MFVDKLQISNYPPTSRNVGWARPLKGGGFALYLFMDGVWQAQKLMDDKSTIYTDDDEVTDISDIDNVVEEKVTEQMQSHDVAVRDVHNSDSRDAGDYPDITII